MNSYSLHVEIRSERCYVINSKSIHLSQLLNTGYLRRLQDARDPDCASTHSRATVHARPPRNALSRQVLGGLQSGWRREGWRVGGQLAGEVSGRCRGCRVLRSTWCLPRLRSSSRQAWVRPQSKLGGSRTRVWALPQGDDTSWAWSSQGCVWGSIRPAGQLPGPDEVLVPKGPRLAKMLFPPGLLEAELETRRGDDSPQTP